MNATELKTEEQNGVPHHKVASIVALTVVGAIVICGCNSYSLLRKGKSSCEH